MTRVHATYCLGKETFLTIEEHPMIERQIIMTVTEHERTQTVQIPNIFTHMYMRPYNDSDHSCQHKQHMWVRRPSVTHPGRHNMFRVQRYCPWRSEIGRSGQCREDITLDSRPFNIKESWGFPQLRWAGWGGAFEVLRIVSVRWLRRWMMHFLLVDRCSRSFLCARASTYMHKIDRLNRACSENRRRFST